MERPRVTPLDLCAAELVGLVPRWLCHDITLGVLRLWRMASEEFWSNKSEISSFCVFQMSRARKALVIWILFEGCVMRLNYASQLSRHFESWVIFFQDPYEPISIMKNVEGRVLLNVANTCEQFGDFQQKETPDLQYEKSNAFLFHRTVQSLGTTKQLNVNREIGPHY